MKVTCDGLDLSLATSQVARALANKASNPVLEEIKLEAKDDKLKLSATDLELAIERTINAKVEEDGQIMVPGKFFTDFVKKMTSEKIGLEITGKDKLKITYTDSETYIQCNGTADFPSLDITEGEDYFKISEKDLRMLINRTNFSAALDDSRPILKGCCFEISNDKVKVIALDGYRIAFTQNAIKESNIEKSIVIPTKSLTEIYKFLEDGESEIKVYVKDNFVIVDVKDTKIMSRLIEGNYINYNQIIPQNFLTDIIINKNLLEDAIERTTVLSRQEKNNLVKFEIKDKVLTLTSNSDIGNIKENIGVSLKGNDITIAFNARYFTECLRTISDEAIRISFNLSSSPCVITPLEGDEYLYVILPVRIINE